MIIKVSNVYMNYYEFVVDESSPELYYLTIKKTTHPLVRTFT